MRPPRKLILLAVLCAAPLLAGDPVFRGQTPFTRRLLYNAIFFGAYRPPVE